LRFALRDFHLIATAARGACHHKKRARDILAALGQPTHAPRVARARDPTDDDVDGYQQLRRDRSSPSHANP
jgi:hypothetical protein